MLNLSANCMNSRAFFFFCSVAGFIVPLRGAADVVQVLVFIKYTDTRMEGSFSLKLKIFHVTPW